MSCLIPTVVAAALVVQPPGKTPEIVGDSAYFAVVKAAMKQNLEAFPYGECVATWTYSTKATWGPILRGKVHVRNVWDKGSFGAEAVEEVLGDPANTCSNPEDAAAVRNGTMRLIPSSLRFVVRDGKCWRYLAPNRLEVVPIKDAYAMPLSGYVDIRPEDLWTTKRVRPLEEMIGPHPNFPSDGIVKWEVVQNDTIIQITRHDKDKGGEGKSVKHYDLSKGGNIVFSEYTSKVQYSKMTCEWRDAGNGAFFLAVMNSSAQDGRNEPMIKNLEVTKFDVSRKPDPTLFSIDWLRCRPGANVIDRVSGKNYTLSARRVDADLLQKLGTKSREWLNKRRDAADAPR